MRFFITGPTGSGKSTLARHLSAKLGLPVQSLDDLHWVRSPSGDDRRAPEERTAMLEPITLQSAWVVEGVQLKWADAAIERADCIIVLNIPRWQRLLFIAKRFVHRRYSAKSKRQGSLAALRQELAWHRDYHQHERNMLLAKVRPWDEKVIIAGSSGDAISQIDADWTSRPRSA